MNIVMVQLQR